jgi:hypothetical protein
VHRGYWGFFGSSLVALDEPLPLPLGVAVEPLAEPETLPLVEPPVADFSLSFSASVVAALDELEAAGGLDAPDEGLDALGEVELELELPALGELDGGGEDGVDDALPLEPEPGELEVLSPLSWPQAARPSANATATANVESLMCSSKVGTNRKASKVWAGCKPLMKKGIHPARRTLCL